MTVKEMQNESGFVLVKKHGGNGREELEGCTWVKMSRKLCLGGLPCPSKGESVGH